jgi:predicted RNase H-like nuclease (RuvC/YqgF family)
MKLILTEEQLKLVQLIKENTDFAEQAKDKIKDIKENLDRLYNIIMFTTIAEIRDGETDILVMERKVEELDDKINNIVKKVSDYFDRYDEDTYYAKKLDEIHSDLENRISTLNRKVMALGKIVEQLKPFGKVREYGGGRKDDWNTPFDNITPTKV